MCGGTVGGIGRKKTVAAQTFAVERSRDVGFARDQEEARERVGRTAREIGLPLGQTAEGTRRMGGERVGLRRQIGRNPHDAFHHIGRSGRDHEDGRGGQERKRTAQGRFGLRFHSHAQRGEENERTDHCAPSEHGNRCRERGRNEAAHQALTNLMHAQSSRLRSSTKVSPKASARSRRGATSAV